VRTKKRLGKSEERVDRGSCDCCAGGVKSGRFLVKGTGRKLNLQTAGGKGGSWFNPGASDGLTGGGREGENFNAKELGGQRFFVISVC